MTFTQRDRIAAIIHGRNFKPSPPHEPTEAELHRAQLTAAAKRIAREVQACAVCGTPIFAHPTVHGHEWEPNPLVISQYDKANNAEGSR